LTLKAAGNAPSSFPVRIPWTACADHIDAGQQRRAGMVFDSVFGVSGPADFVSLVNLPFQK